MKESTDTYPLVSVLMTAYNREKYIAEAIESVLASTYQNFELIIVDDCSDDGTVEIARKYEQEDSRVRVYVNEKNLGQFPNRNKASEYATGKYIYYCDSDDTLFRDGLQNLIAIMEEHPDCSFGMYNSEAETPVILPPKTAIHNHFFQKPFLNCGPAGTILRRDFFEKIGKYPTEFGIPGDMYFNLKAASRCIMLLIPFEFMNYRIHDGQELSIKYDYLYNNYKYMNAALNQLNLHLNDDEKTWLHKKNKRRFTVNITKYFLKTLDFKKTRNAINLAGFNLTDALQGIFH